MPIWEKIDQSNLLEIIQQLSDSIECTRDEKNRVELVFHDGRLAYFYVYSKEKGESYEKLEAKYHVASLDDIIGYWTLNREQIEHEKSFKNNLGSR